MKKIERQKYKNNTKNFKNKIIIKNNKTLIYCCWLDLRDELADDLSFSLCLFLWNNLNIPLFRSSLFLPVPLLIPERDDIDWASLSLELSADTLDRFEAISG